MDRATIESLRHGAHFLDVTEDDLGIPRGGPASPPSPDGLSGPSDAEVGQFVETVSQMRVGDRGILPPWLVGELAACLGTGRQILMWKSVDERTGDCEWSQDVHERSAGAGVYSRERARLLHKVPTGKTGRWTVSDDYEIWLLDGARLFACHCDVFNIGTYDDGTSSSGYFNDSWTVHRSGKAVLQCEEDHSFRFLAEDIHAGCLNR